LAVIDQAALLQALKQRQQLPVLTAVATAAVVIAATTTTEV